MPSQRKKKRREDKLYEDGWFPISSDMWLEPGELPRKLRIIADANFPDSLVQRIKGKRIDIRTARSLGLEKLSDENLLSRVAELGCVLITLDRDFWSDERFPLHRRGGIIFIDGKDGSIGRTVGFQLLTMFLVSFGGRWSSGKFRASSERVYVKFITTTNKKGVYEMRAMRGAGIFARELEGFEI